ncbi:MAG: hypothetical protein KAI79_03935 [Bacteroidales bacterium]|nr:hypothetical protein [Bacteroidales bacterium]
MLISEDKTNTTKKHNLEVLKEKCMHKKNTHRPLFKEIYQDITTIAG